MGVILPWGRGGDPKALEPGSEIYVDIYIYILESSGRPSGGLDSSG